MRSLQNATPEDPDTADWAVPRLVTLILVAHLQQPALAGETKSCGRHFSGTLPAVDQQPPGGMLVDTSARVFDSVC